MADMKEQLIRAFVAEADRFANAGLVCLRVAVNPLSVEHGQAELAAVSWFKSSAHYANAAIRCGYYQMRWEERR